MRPEILNPLFAALTDLKGVGPQLAKPLTRLGLERVVDVLFHLPTGLISRVPVDRLDQAQAGQTIIVELTAQDYRPGRSPRAPFGVEAFDQAGDHVRASRASCSRSARNAAYRGGSTSMAICARSSIPTMSPNPATRRELRCTSRSIR
jgi:RecG-like helicase